MARREVGAATRALQRCLPRRRPSLELEFDLRASGFTELCFGGVVEAVSSEAVCTKRGEERVSGRGASVTVLSGGRVYPARPNHPT